MYARRRTIQQKARRSALKKFPAPVAGWIENRNISEMPQPGQPQGAAVLDNFFPTQTTVRLRRGSAAYATLGDGDQPVRSLFSYINGNNQRLFAADDGTIYDITSVLSPRPFYLVDGTGDLIVTEDDDWFSLPSAQGLEVFQFMTGGEWQVVQFATTGGVYLIGVNGADDGFIYDGTDFFPILPDGVFGLHYKNETESLAEGDTVTGGSSGTTATIVRVWPDDNAPGEGVLWLADIVGSGFSDGETLTDSDTGEVEADGATSQLVPGIAFSGNLTSKNMAFVWVYKNRLWFAERDSMNAWYMAVDSIGGSASIFPLAGVFGQGGSLLFGQTWSLDAGQDGGLSEQSIFVSTRGEVAVYQGSDPDEADGFQKVGLYRIGTPLGRRAWFRGGGDIAIATSVGLVPLSKAIDLDVTALSVATVSYNIAEAWAGAVGRRGMDGWQCHLWPEEKMALIVPPSPRGSTPVIFVANTETGAWARYTGWKARCMEVFQGRFYFGSDDGLVLQGGVTGADDGQVYTGACVPLFEDLGEPASLKVPKVGRGTIRARMAPQSQLCFQSDYDTALPAAPDAQSIAGGNTWGNAIWGQAVWSSETPSAVTQQWVSLGGTGYSVSLSMQVSSGSTAPLDVEIIQLELSYTAAGIVS